MNIFGFRDDALRTGFQAGLERVDGTPRPSLAAVRDAIAASACATGGGTHWRPTRSVLGASAPSVRLGRRSIAISVTAGEGASARACLLGGAHTLSSVRRALSSVRAVACASGRVDANRSTTLLLGRSSGRQTLAVRLSADANPGRSTTVIRVVSPA